MPWRAGSRGFANRGRRRSSCCTSRRRTQACCWIRFSLSERQRQPRIYIHHTDRVEAGRKCRSLRFAAEAAAPVGMTRLKAAADRTEARTVLKAKVKSKGNHGFSRIDTDKNEAGRKCRSLRFAAEAAAPVGMTRLKAAADRTEARTVLKAKVKSKGNHGFSRIDTDKNEAGRKCRSLRSLRSLGMTNQREGSGGSGRDDKIEGSRGSHGGAD